jgi:carboxymethylenebutenolidase
MSARTEWIDLRADDGTSLRAFVAKPDRQATRGLLVFQEAFGVNAHIRDVTERFAAEGFLAISPELFHRTAPGFECGYSEFALATPHLLAITNRASTPTSAAFGWLGAGRRRRQQRRGGLLPGRPRGVRRQLRGAPLKAAASGYGGRIPPLIGRAPKLSGLMLFLGRPDHHIPEAIGGGGRRWRARRR